jgi:hypothetical protein
MVTAYLASVEVLNSNSSAAKKIKTGKSKNSNPN